MIPFKFEFHGELYEADFKHYLSLDGYDRFRVNISNGDSLVIMRFGLDKRIWTQAVQFSTEYNFPHDYVQAMGEGIDRISPLKENQE